MEVQKIAETNTTITLGWTPVPGCIGYVLYVDGKRTSNTWDATKDNWRVSKGAQEYKIVALGVEDQGVYPTVTPPLPTGNRLARLSLTTPETITVTDSNKFTAAYNLASGRDYVVVLRPGINGLVPIRGGRNVNVIGEGAFKIDNTLTASPFWNHTGISIYPGDAGSSVHVENVCVEGATVVDGIVWACPQRHVRIQTCLLKNTSWASTPPAPGQPAPLPGLHQDGVQSQGGALSVEMDLVTIYTVLQGTFFGDHDGVIGPTHMTRVNMVGGMYAFWKSNPDAAPVLLEDCWLADGSRPSIGLWVFPNEKGEKVYDQYRTATARVSADGQYVDFPGTCITGGFRKGRPPGGDFVV